MEKYEPQEACLALAVDSYKAWLATEARTDDISVIVVHFQLGTGLTCAPGSAASQKSSNALPCC